MIDIAKILENYSMVGDNITFVLCIVLMILKHLTYSKRDITLKVFTWAIHLLTMASSAQLTYFLIVKYDGLNLFTLCLKVFYYLCLTCIFMCYSRYIVESFDTTKKESLWIARFTIIPGCFMLLVNIIYLVTSVIKDINITIADLEMVATRLFMITYIYYILFFGIILYLFKNRIIKKVVRSFVITTSIAVFTMFFSTIQKDTSFLTFTFILPLIAAYNLLHNNPFDIALGTLDANAFENYLFDLKNKKTSFALVCIYLEDTKNKEYVKAIRKELNTTYANIVDKSYLFKINDNKFVLVVKDREIVVKDFSTLENTLEMIYDKYNINYKITFVPSYEILNETKNYIKINKFIESRMPNNSIYVCNQEDVDLFMKDSYIIEQLHDIVKKDDLNDERVLVYCQPVYNTVKQKYDSAEALMRLKLPDLGLIFPDQFIPLAEKEKCIHVLSKIILNKTCAFIKDCKKNNLDIKRISVNFSIVELKDKNFCTDIINIINQNGVSFKNIAIELTESKSEHDFDIIKEKVEELKKLGMYFYLDDFGTGYSNLDRIMQLPIDIIKFDRSLVLLSGKDIRYHHTIRGFSTTFEELGYKILFEGIENKEDEDMCINMNAQYLQGYKYSKPIPINELKNFIDKKIIHWQNQWIFSYHLNSFSSNGLMTISA